MGKRRNKKVVIARVFTNSEILIYEKNALFFTLRESRVMPSRLGGILKGSQYLSSASPLTPWICGILGFYSLEVRTDRNI